MNLVPPKSESAARTKRAQLRTGEERLIKLSAGAKMFGDDSADAIRKRLPPYDRLTIVDLSGPDAQRRKLRLVYSECVALRDELIQNARQRTSVARMLDAKRRQSQIREVVNG